jgi:hypothetical protein
MSAARGRVLAVVLAAATAGAASCPAHAADGSDNCIATITSLPATIATQGVWCLDGNLASSLASGKAIDVDANNVTIDCNGFKISGTGAGAGTTAIGIFSDRSNTTVRGCLVTGFYTGVHLTSAGGGHVVEDNRIDANLANGIIASGSGSLVRGNQVRRTGGSTSNLDATVVGILLAGTGEVRDNLVAGVTSAQPSPGFAVGIEVQGTGDGGRVTGNTIGGVSMPDGRQSFGIFLDFGRRMVAVSDNDIAGDGTASSYGIYCVTAGGGVLVDNSALDTATAFGTCTDVSGNVQ